MIRKEGDKGIVILADTRILTKAYGKIFLASLPGGNILRLTTDEITADIKRNFGE